MHHSHADRVEKIHYEIGIVFDVGGRGDQSFNDSAYNGMKMIAEQYKGYIKDDPDEVDFGKEIELKYLEPQAKANNWTERQKTMKLLTTYMIATGLMVGAALMGTIIAIKMIIPLFTGG